LRLIVLAASDAIAELLAAIESRDLRAIEAALTPDATWQNVPSSHAAGRDAVLAMLAPIVTWSDEVRWDVVSSNYDETTGWLERVDRFVIDGVEHAVRCNGVFEVRDGRVAVVRDYVDVAEWRTRIGPVMERLRERPALAVVARHLAAVDRRELAAMPADYAMDAELARGDSTYRGWRAIADYFDTVPDRLAGRQLLLGLPVQRGDEVVVEWTIPGVAEGQDRYRVRAGRITHQFVELATPDF
jgi:limonene-1,2-epoxide hydrolase